MTTLARHTPPASPDAQDSTNRALVHVGGLEVSLPVERGLVRLEHPQFAGAVRLPVRRVAERLTLPGLPQLMAGEPACPVAVEWNGNLYRVPGAQLMATVGVVTGSGHNCHLGTPLGTITLPTGWLGRVELPARPGQRAREVRPARLLGARVRLGEQGAEIAVAGAWRLLPPGYRVSSGLAAG